MKPSIALPASCAVALAIGGMALGIFAISAGEAWPHEAIASAVLPKGWSYPFSCCASYDCRQTKAGEVTERPDGYHTPGGIVGYQDKRIKDSPDGLFHICAHQAGVDAGKTICLFVPPRSY